MLANDVSGKITANLIQAAVLAACVLFITSCSEQSSLEMVNNPSTDTSAGNLNLTVPNQILSARAVNLDALIAEVTINGETTSYDRTSDFTITTEIDNGDMLNLLVQWFQDDSDAADPLLLASYSLSQQITGDSTISIPAAEFETDGGAFDADDDTFSNLEELDENSNPRNSNETPDNKPDVRIPWVSPAETPVIDGLYDQIWDSARFSDVRGERLSIDNLMINQGAIRPDGDTEFRWAAMHDDSNLYIFVLAETESRSNPTRDSSGVWNDDNINVFIDGDNSKLSEYDGVDDRQILIPLLATVENPASNSSGSDRPSFILEGAFSAPLDVDVVEFGTCVCTSGPHTWEIKLPFSDFGITKNVPFGIEIQLDIDHDGGARDAKWGWHHKSRATDGEDVDETWTTPSADYMGTAIIE